MNAYERAFLDHVTRLNISPGPDFAALTREAFEKEWGGQADALLAGLNRKTLESPKKLASALSQTYGEGALQYFKQIVRYAESKSLHPEDAEDEHEQGVLESVISEIEADSPETPGPDAFDES